jgi:excisionase family DNA binding protein
MTEDGDLVEAYRRADQRLRLMLLGDGVSEPGMVKGEESRARVTAALRHIRDLFARAVGEDSERVVAAEARMARLEEELLRVASLAAARADEAPGDADRFLTPAEAAEELGVSVSSVYRAVRNDRIRALRAANRRNGELRIPASELLRVRGGRGSL